MYFDDFITLHNRSIGTRRSLCGHALRGEIDGAAARELGELSAEIDALCDPDGALRLDTPGGPIATHARYERTELRRDALLAAEGFDAIIAEASHVRGGSTFAEASRSPDGSTLAGASHTPGGSTLAEAEMLAESLCGQRFARFITDRDGTVNGYCARYATAVQPAWAALCLTRFVESCCERSVMLTAGPLRGPGIVDLSTMPAGAMVLAASKGREYRREDGDEGAQPLPEAGAAALERFTTAVTSLHAEERYRIFAYVGSGLQIKHGMVAVGYQDTAGTVPRELAAEYRRRLEEAIAGSDPDRTLLGVEDTGREMEVALREGSDGHHGFDKGDGVQWLDSALRLQLAGNRVLVCGDTASDVPMVERATALGARVTAIFAGAGEAVRERVGEVAAEAFFVDSYEALLLGLYMMVPEDEHEYEVV